MRRIQLLVMSLSLVVCAVCGVVIVFDGSHAVAQTGSSKSKLKTPTTKSKVAGDAKELDARAEKNLEGFLIESLKLAEDYERVGKFDEAQDQLRTVKRLKPDFQGIDEKLNKLNESLFETNELETEQDVADGWKRRVHVFRGKPVRVQAQGSYKVVMNATADADGFATKDPRTDMAAGVRCGALMGIIVPTGESSTKSARSEAPRTGNDKDKIGDPFEIGASKEFTPKEDGVLLLNVNLPPGHKSIGKLRIRLSGHIKLMSKEERG
jgi:hypothetical protein